MSKSSFRTVLTGLILAFPVTANFAKAEPAGAAVLTITGKIGAANRGPFDAFRDGFFKFQDKNRFKRGFAFDRAMLAGLKQVTVTARAVNWPAPISFTGPLLRDVLARAKAHDRKIVIHALDGYKQEFTRKELAGRPWVLAIIADGKPLGIGGRGPGWLVHATPRGKPATQDEEAKWVWSVFYMEAK
jgi:hypothetical protein